MILKTVNYSLGNSGGLLWIRNELEETIKSSEILDYLSNYKLLIKVCTPRSHLHWKLNTTTQEIKEEIGEFEGLINQPTERTLCRESRDSP